MSLFKRIIALTPGRFQEELKRIYFRRQIRNGKFVSDEIEFGEIHKFVNEGDWVIDIGANVGHYTIKLSELVGSAGRVIAFEPIPVTFAHLAENTLHSKYKNITLINAAVSEKTERVGMSIPDFNTGLKNYYEATISNKITESDTSVLTVSIDSLQINHKISLIKVDAEGHEPAVFSGAIKLIEKNLPVIIVETVTDQIRKDLQKLGYNEEVFKGSHNTIFKIQKS